jgi:predicted transport protein
VTAGDHPGRIDTLGLDENNCPTIIEFKRHTNQNVISQILFYFDWLKRNSASFELLVQKKLGADAAREIDWDHPRLICIAGDYGRFDLRAITYVGPSVELLTYRHYGDDLLLLDYITENVTPPAAGGETVPTPEVKSQAYSGANTMAYRVEASSLALRDLLQRISDEILRLGEDVQVAELKMYWAFKKIKNFACVEVKPGLGHIVIYVRLNPANLDLVPGFTRDVHDVGHFGTGDLAVTVASEDDLARAMPLIRQAYASV